MSLVIFAITVCQITKSISRLFPAAIFLVSVGSFSHKKAFTNYFYITTFADAVCAIYILHILFDLTQKYRNQSWPTKRKKSCFHWNVSNLIANKES